MAQKDITFAVKAKIQADASEAKKAIVELQEAIGGTLKDDTSLYKNIAKQIDKLKEKVSDFTLIGEQNIISRTDVAQAERLARDIFKRMARIADQYKGGAVKFFDIPKENLDKIEKLEEAYKNVQPREQRTGARKLKASLKDPSVSQQIFSSVYGGSRSTRLDIKDTDTFSSYRGRIEAERTRTNERLKVLNASSDTEGSIKQAAKALAEAGKELTRAQKKAETTQLKALNPGITNYNNAPTQKRIFGAYSEVAGATFRTNAGLQEFLRGLVFKPGTNEFLAQGTEITGDQTALGLLKLLETDQDKYKEIINAANQKDSDREDVRNKIAALFEQTVSSLGLKDFRAKVQPKAGNMVTSIKEGISNTPEVQTAQTTYNNLEPQVTQLESERNALTTLQANLDSLSDRIAALEQVFYAADEEAERAEKKAIRDEVKATAQEGKTAVMGDVDTSVRSQEEVATSQRLLKEDIAESDSAAKEAENFKNRIQAAVKQWMGAREIINYVKQGIREAYQDIQNLDKAMTNIAVVTDFSVEDLWGQINDYMAIAKQYGVTAQGVYEVTQLFYQQGLGTNDTMDATIETLKMARIAGVSYSDAADGMTVAIRAFNMEMEDAAHVTDVYSKVAAVTASDTQELIEAMSKTASGAANVGSSFENTTAMIATMVEATRESPENIGSALKSIISRFGEMKAGSAFDEDGELIDVNKVQTALASVGVSLLDAQGQFRDFDDVIFELADKWDTLDKNSQRYVATIAAGNRLLYQLAVAWAA